MIFCAIHEAAKLAPMLFGQAARPRLSIWEILQGYGWLMAAVLVLVVVVAMTAAWYRRTRDEQVDSANLLLDFKALHRQGELTDEEYTQIKRKLGNRPAVRRPRRDQSTGTAEGVDSPS